MVLDPAALPDDVAALKAMLIAEHKRAEDLNAEIETLKLTIAKLRQDRFGNSSERTSVLIDQLELQLGELMERRAQETAAEEIAADQVTQANATKLRRRMPARRPLPERLPRERVVLPSPSGCARCGGSRLRKLGEDVTETVERIRRSGRSSSTCARSGRAATARASRSRPPRRTRSRAAGPARSCWPRSCIVPSVRRAPLQTFPGRSRGKHLSGCGQPNRARGRQLHSGHSARQRDVADAKDPAQSVGLDGRHVACIDIRRLQPDVDIAFSPAGRNLGPSLPALDLRPPIGGEEHAGRGRQQHEADRDGSGQHTRDGRHCARAQAGRSGCSPDRQVQTSWNSHGASLADTVITRLLTQKYVIEKWP
jgi:transposase IS166 family protein